MRKKISMLLFMLLISVGAMQTVQAQLQIGGGLIYGTEIEEFGIQGNATLNIPGPIRLAADIGIFFVDDVGNLDTSLWEINFNGHYLFPGIPKANVYGLAGINIVTASVEGQVLGVTFDESDSELGLNVGGGAEIPIGFAKLFGELKYVLGDADQAVFTGGLRFSIGK